MELFWKKGFHATSISDLVAYLGINRASLYATYGDKEMLHKEALEYYRQMGHRNLASLPPYESDLRNWLRDFLYGIIEESRQDVDRKGCFIVNAAVDLVPEDKTISEFVLENQEFFVNRFLPVFLKAMEQGELDPAHDPRVLALYLFNAVNGLRVLARTTDNFDELRAVADTTIRVFY